MKEVAFSNVSEIDQIIVDETALGLYHHKTRIEINQSGYVQFHNQTERNAGLKANAIREVEDTPLKGKHLRLLIFLIRLLIQNGVIAVNDFPQRWIDFYTNWRNKEDLADS